MKPHFGYRPPWGPSGRIRRSLRVAHGRRAEWPIPSEDRIDRQTGGCPRRLSSTLKTSRMSFPGDASSLRHAPGSPGLASPPYSVAPASEMTATLTATTQKNSVHVVHWGESGAAKSLIMTGVVSMDEEHSNFEPVGREFESLRAHQINSASLGAIASGVVAAAPSLAIRGSCDCGGDRKSR
jgi:hypothetical protein